MTNEMRHVSRIEGPVPEGFRFPELAEMANGNERCDHPCDVEHTQDVDGTTWCTSIVWTTDGGVGEPGLEAPMIGCQWIGSVEFLDDPISLWDNGWREQVSVILDCDADTPSEDAIRIVHGLLSDVTRSAVGMAGQA